MAYLGTFQGFRFQKSDDKIKDSLEKPKNKIDTITT